MIYFYTVGFVNGPFFYEGGDGRRDALPVFARLEGLQELRWVELTLEWVREKKFDGLKFSKVGWSDPGPSSIRPI